MAEAGSEKARAAYFTESECRPQTFKRYLFRRRDRVMETQ